MDDEWKPWWKGWGRTFRLLYWSRPNSFDLPDIPRFCALLGLMFLLAALCGRGVAIVLMGTLWAVGALCWAAHKRARMVDWINDWAAKND